VIDGTGLLNRDEVLTIARDQLETDWSLGVDLTEDDMPNEKEMRGDAIDTAVSLSGLHYDIVAPMILPVAVEETFVLELDGYPVNLSGRKDIREANAIRDTKTAKTAATMPEAGVPTFQAILYSMAERKAGRSTSLFITDGLIKTKVPKYVRVDNIPSEADTKRLLARVDAACGLIETVREGKTGFQPADPTHWRCSRRWCGFADDCKYWSGKIG
jgi:hypothetical protein